MRKLITLLVVLPLAFAGCKRRSQNEIKESSDQPGTSDASEANLDKLKLERNALISQLEAQQVEGAKKIAELTLERDELNTQKTSVELDIARLQAELESSTTAEQKEQAQKKLNLAVQERDELNVKLTKNADTIKDLLKKMDSLSEEIRKANAKISELNTKIETLEKELAVERSKIETVSTTNFPTPQAGTSAATTTTPTPTPTATPTATPSNTPATPTPGVVSNIACSSIRGMRMPHSAASNSAAPWRMPRSWVCPA